MAQQTAMQKLLTNLESIGIKIPQGIKDIYLQMEKEQRIRDYNVGYLEAKCNHVQDAESYLVEQEYLASKSAK